MCVHYLLEQIRKTNKMKKLISMPLGLLAVLGVLVFGCESDSTEATCEKFPTPTECTAATVQASACVADDGSQYYLFNDKKYDYTETGKEALIQDMCGDVTESAKAAIMLQLSKETELLMTQIRAAALCD